MIDLTRMRRVWPDGKKNSVQRAYDMVKGYREVALLHDPDRVAALDRRYAEWGEYFHLDKPIVFEYDDDDVVPTLVVAELTGMQTSNISKLRALGYIEGEYISQSVGWVYRVGDVRALRGKMPGRGWRRRWSDVMPRISERS